MCWYWQELSLILLVGVLSVKLGTYCFKNPSLHCLLEYNLASSEDFRVVILYLHPNVPFKKKCPASDILNKHVTSIL